MAFAASTLMTHSTQPDRKTPQPLPLTDRIQRTIRILVLDDDANDLLIFERYIRKTFSTQLDVQLQTMFALGLETINEVLEDMRSGNWDLVISDLNWSRPGAKEGFELLQEWKQLPEGTRPGLVIWSNLLPEPYELPSIEGFERVMLAKKPGSKQETEILSEIIAACAKD